MNSCVTALISKIDPDLGTALACRAKQIAGGVEEQVAVGSIGAVEIGQRGQRVESRRRSQIRFPIPSPMRHLVPPAVVVPKRSPAESRIKRATWIGAVSPIEREQRDQRPVPRWQFVYHPHSVRSAERGGAKDVPR